jgi:hypothetical protein
MIIAENPTEWFGGRAAVRLDLVVNRLAGFELFLPL